MSNKNQHLSPENAEIIKNQTFSDTQPGSLLKDFQALLDFIGDDGIDATKTTHHIGMKYLFELNERMTRPVETELKRPQQKTFPVIHGLYLLLRTSGLGRLVAQKSKTLIVLDQDILTSWRSLNTKERYFSLLFFWVSRGEEEVLGERSGIYGSSFLNAVYIYRTASQGGNSSIVTECRYYGPHNIALLALFGFIEAVPKKSNKSVDTADMQVVFSSFGKVMLTYLGDAVSRFMNETGNYLSDELYDFCAKDLNPLIPDWQNRLLIKEREVLTEGYSVIAVKVRDAVRKLAVPHDTFLDDLASSILDAFNFDEDHLYEFIYKNSIGLIERVAHSFADDGDYWADDMTLGEMPIHEGMTFVFHYDFGDDWRFQCLVETVIKEGGKYTEPKVIEKKGRAPKQYYY
ncbi:IS1096 element passenger TnpR family protein [Methylotuvimicrobium sp.]|uniref:IS1096 element passenger TnpR family protein n=1 Tax=Methylotuvimicrobium sp. TaxID=2822413 RepID=UPI003D65C382